MPPASLGYRVWHCERCEELRCVVYVDDELLEYGQYLEAKPWVVRTPTELVVSRARKITIMVAARLVLVNPVDDDARDDVIERLERVREAILERLEAAP